MASTPTLQSAPDAQVLEQLQVIDTSLLDKLVQIRMEQARLESYRHKAAELKGAVKGPVWSRVVEDYAARATMLREQAAPLKIEAQREYQKLRSVHDRIATVYEGALLDKEELEFREAVGELSHDDLKAKLDGPERRLEDCRRDLEAIEAQKAKFVEAFGSEADLDMPSVPATGPAPDTPSRPAATPEPAASLPTSSEITIAPVAVTAVAKPSDLTDASAAATPSEVSKPSEVARSPEVARPSDVAMPSETAMPPEQAAVPLPPATAAAPSPDTVRDSTPDATSSGTIRVPAAARSSAEDPADSLPVDATRIVSSKAPRFAPERSSASKPPDDRTLLLPRASLLITLGGAQTQQSLGPINYLGRTDENQIQINTPNVSRRHALIRFTQAGFTLKDLGSQNGTFLNGERVSEKALADGDRVVVGDARIVFRLQ